MSEGAQAMPTGPAGIDRSAGLDWVAVSWSELLGRLDSIARHANSAAWARTFRGSFREGTAASRRWLGVLKAMREQGGISDDEVFFSVTVLILELAGDATAAADPRAAQALRSHGEDVMAGLCEAAPEVFLHRCRRGREMLARR